MATVVVVQSDELAAWIGVAGVVVGVVLTAGIDTWRSRRAERKQQRDALIRAGGELARAATALAKAERAAGSHRNEAAWIEAIDARANAMADAGQTIRLAGEEALDEAALRIVAVALREMPEADPDATSAYVTELGGEVARFTAAVRHAKL
jgi:sugar phosphate isomerase/epimerase